MRAPTRRTSTLGFCDAVCARAAAASAAKSILFRNRYMLPGNAYDFGAGVLHLHLARDEADQRAADQHEAADPDPRDEREDVSLNHGALVIVRHAAEIQVEI